MDSSHPIQQQVRTVARRSQQWLALYGVSSFLCIGLLGVFVAGWVDYWCRFRESGPRVVVSAAILLLLAWSFFKFVVPTFRHRYTNLQVACLIERRFPELRDRLSSSIEFLERADQATGSAELREQLVSEANAIAAKLNLLDSINPTAVKRVLLGTTLGASILVATCSLDPQSSLRAGRRLATPWSEEHWPKRHSLVLVDPPSQVAAGQDIALQVIDRQDRLPTEVRIEYLFDGDESAQIQSRLMKPSGQTMVDHLSNVTRSLAVRAIGGDDDGMDWHRIQVVQPPKVVDFHLQVQPPDYTDWSTELAGRHLRVLEGSQISLVADTDRPLKSVRWHAASSGSAEPTHRAQLHQDLRGFSWPVEPFFAHKSTSFWFELTDLDEVQNDSQLRCELQVVRDLPPTISIESPGLDVALTPSAVVQLKAIVKDDLQIDQITLHFRDQTVSLETPASHREPKSAWSGDDVRIVEYSWDLAQTMALTAGEQIEFHLEATDMRPQAGRSESRQLRIVSADEFERRADQRQQTIRDLLADALRAQQNARLPVSSLQRLLDEGGQLHNSEIELLQSTEMQQRMVRTLLDNEQNGVITLIQSLLADMVGSRVAPNPVQRLLPHLLQQVEQLAHSPLGDIERGLRNSIEAVRRQAANEDLKSLLRATGQSQDTVAAKLEQMLDDLSQRASFGRFSREVARIRHQQMMLAAETRDLKTVGRSHGELTAEQRASLRRLAHSQRELGRQFDRLQTQIQSASDELTDADEETANTLHRALRVMRANALGGLMRDAATGVEGNQLGRADELQRRVHQGLGNVLAALADRELTGQASGSHGDNRLANIKPELAKLAKRQQSVRLATDQLHQARSDAFGRLEEQQLTELHQLIAQQRDLAERTAALADRVAEAEVFALGLASARREMIRAVEPLEQARTDELTSNTQAAALRHLKRLIQSLQPPTQQNAAEASNTPQGDGPNAQLKLTELRLLRQMQEDINRRTIEVHRRRNSAGDLAAVWQAELQHLAAEQGRLAEVVSQSAGTDAPDDHQSSTARDD